MRIELLSGTIAAGIPTVEPRVPVVAVTAADTFSLLANAAQFATMQSTQLREKCNVHAQQHPSMRMPAVAGGRQATPTDYGKPYMCPWHGDIEDRFRDVKGEASKRSHFTSEGICRALGKIGDGDAMTYWLKRWKLPGPGQTYYEANPEAAATAGKRRRSS